jgi:hypothetical protein
MVSISHLHILPDDCPYTTDISFLSPRSSKRSAG